MIDEIASSNAQVARVFIPYFTKLSIVDAVDELRFDCVVHVGVIFVDATCFLVISCLRLPSDHSQVGGHGRKKPRVDGRSVGSGRRQSCIKKMGHNYPDVPMLAAT